MFLQLLFSLLSWRQEILAYKESLLTIQVGWRMEGVEFKEEWQDEDFPRFLILLFLSNLNQIHNI